MVDKKNFFPNIKIYKPEDLNKRWFVYWKENGKRRVKYGRINQYVTKEERLAEAQKLIKSIKRSQKPKISPFEVEAREWMERKRPFWRHKSFKTFDSIVNIFFEWLNGRDLNAKNVEAFFLHLSKIRSANTYNKYRFILARVFKEIGRTGLLDKIEIVKQEGKPARYFQKHQVVRLKNYISENNPELWLFIQFVYYCFIRPGELRLLRVGDILLDEEKIMMRSAITKNKKTQYVAIPSAFLPELMFLYDLRPMDLVFHSKGDSTKPIGINTMARKHRAILKELGFTTEYKLYSWKHTGAVRAVENGVNLKELQIQLRHHSLDQVNEYLRQMGVSHMGNLKDKFPPL